MTHLSLAMTWQQEYYFIDLLSSVCFGAWIEFLVHISSKQIEIFGFLFYKLNNKTYVI